MAYFSFTQDILQGKPLTEYRKADGTELQRDFTYVSDIVDGIIAASELGAPLEVFNLGNTHPEKVSTLIHLLEEGLGRKANISQAPCYGVYLLWGVLAMGCTWYGVYLLWGVLAMGCTY